jgi:hypothetical protein
MVFITEHCPSGELDSALGEPQQPSFFHGFIGESTDLVTLP